MEWLRGNWLKALLLIFAIAGWVAHQEIDAAKGKGHRQMVCYEQCIQHCRAWCQVQQIPEDECHCPKLCEERCG